MKWEKGVEGDCPEVRSFLLEVVENVLSLIAVMAAQLCGYTKTNKLHILNG